MNIGHCGANTEDQRNAYKTNDRLVHLACRNRGKQLTSGHKRWVGRAQWAGKGVSDRGNDREAIGFLSTCMKVDRSVTAMEGWLRRVEGDGGPCTVTSVNGSKARLLTTSETG